MTEVIHNAIPSYRIDFLLERYDQKLLLPTKLIHEEKNQVMIKINVINKNIDNKWN